VSRRFPLTRVIIRVLEVVGAGLTSALVAYLLGRTEPSPPAPSPGVVQLAPVDEEMIRSVSNYQAALLNQLRNDADARKTPQVIVESPATPQVAAPAAPWVTPEQATPQQQVMPTAQQEMPQSEAIDVAVSATDLANASGPAKPDKSVQALTPERLRIVDTRPDAKVNIKADAKPHLKLRTAPRAEELLQARPLPGAVVDAVPRNVGQRNFSAPAAAPVAPPPASAADTDTGLSSALKGITARLLPSRDRLPLPDQGAVRPPMPVGEFQQSAM
jgi:hypothetical protein